MSFTDALMLNSVLFLLFIYIVFQKLGIQRYWIQNKLVNQKCVVTPGSSTLPEIIWDIL